MELSVRETAVILGVSPRAVRARLERGELAGTKKGKAWRVRRESLPLTEAQRERIQARADDVRREVEAALPSRIATTRATRRARSVEDSEAFRAGREVLHAIGRSAASTPRLDAAREELVAALIALSQATYEFDTQEKLGVLRRSRSALGACIGRLLLAVADDGARVELAWVETLESRVLPALAGLLRWCERRGSTARAPRVERP